MISTETTINPLEHIQVALLTHGTVRYIHTTQPRSNGTIVCIHGMSYPLEVWRPIQRKAHQDGWNTLSFDLYGRGTSTYRHGTLSPKTLATQVKELLSICNIETDIHILSLSNADWIAIELSILAPQRCLSISMVAPSGLDQRTIRYDIRLFSKLTWLHPIFNIGLRKRIIQRMKQHEQSLPKGVTQEKKEIYHFAQKSIQTNPHFCRAFWSQVAHAHTPKQAREQISRVPNTLPIHILRFAEENDSTLEGISILYQHPKCTDQELKKGTHMALLEHPDMVWPILQNFVHTHKR